MRYNKFGVFLVVFTVLGLNASAWGQAYEQTLVAGIPSKPVTLRRDQIAYYTAEYNEPFIGYQLVFALQSEFSATKLIVCESRVNTHPVFNTTDCDETYEIKGEYGVVIPRYPFSFFGEYYYAVRLESDDPRPEASGTVTLMYVVFDAGSPIPGGTTALPLVQGGDNPMDEERILTNGSTVELSWHVAKNADEYYVYGFPRKCDGDMKYNRLELIQNATLLYKEITSASVGTIIREIEGLNFASSFCINVIAKNSKTQESAAYVAISVYSSQWYGPEHPTPAKGSVWIVVGVCIVFAIGTAIGLFVYWYIRTREQNSFEMYY